MKVVVIGGGEVGYHLAARLSVEQHDVTVVERNPDLAGRIQSQLDVLVVEGNGASLTCLEKAGIRGADLLLAVTNFDEVNLIACLIAAQFQVELKVARVSNPEYSERRGILEEKRFGADLLINPEQECAREIFKLFHRLAATDVAEFAGGRVVLLALPVGSAAPAVGRSLEEIGRALEGRHFLTVAIDRDNESIIPDGATRIQAGDTIYLISEAEYLPEAYRLLGLEGERIRRAMLLGGGRVGTHLATMLEREGVQPTVIEQDRDRCVALAEKLESGLVLHGDATDLDLLSQEGIAETDGLAAVTSEDETNLLASLLAKHLGAKKVITLLKRSEYIPLVTRIGIDAAVSPRLSTANRILQHVRGGRILSMAVMERNQAEAMEYEVLPGSRVEGKRIADLHLPQGTILGSIERGDQVIIPRGDTRVEQGDRVVVFALPAAIDETTDFFR
ncbi:MAG TPA: Trk system potassium transporter TrkA [Gemmatimonadota bacterium]|nr:Trk system potassium transporter TrkA [Gemmatimonadota bacterium]